MDFTKFVAMLESESLYFCQLACLGDPFEGSLPNGTLNKMQKKCKELEGEGSEEARERIQTLAHNAQQFRRAAHMASHTFYANCWHSNTYESDAMWKLYLSSGEGIAVVSTVKRLIVSLQNCQEEIHIGKMKYIDYDRGDIHNPDGTLNLFNFAMRKRTSFSHERELRAVYWNLPEDGTNGVQLPPGIPVRVRLNTLIGKIYVGPLTPRWFLSLVETVTKRYGIRAKVVESKLALKPVR